MDCAFRNILSVKNVPWLRDHQVGSEIVFPAAGYLAMAVEAATQAIEQHNRKGLEVLEIKGFTFRNVYINYFEVHTFDGRTICAVT